MARTIINETMSGKTLVTRYNNVTYSGQLKVYPTIGERDEDSRPGKFAWVTDATDDPAIDRGSALYVRMTGGVWVLVYAEEQDFDGEVLFPTLDVSWDDINDRPQSDVSDIDQAVASKHSHENKTTLDKLGESDGQLTLNGTLVCNTTADLSAMSARISNLEAAVSELQEQIVSLNETLQWIQLHLPNAEQQSTTP